MTKDERARVEAYLRRRFGAKTLEVRSRPQKDDSAEVYIGEEFTGVISKDEDEGELAYHFTMTILDFDLDEDGA